MPTVCDVLLEVLAEAGVRHLFGLPGDALNTLVDAERRQQRLRFVHVRHEENAALAASATAKLTGRLGACMGTAGPGAIHLLNGLYDARRDHAPVLAISGQVESALLGTGYHQEVDLHSLFADVAVFNATVVNPAQLPELATIAVRTALAKRGVAHLSIPLDIGGMKVPHAKRAAFVPTSAETVPGADQLDPAARMLGEAKRIVILAGIGALSARGELLQLAEALGAPIVKTLRAKELLPDEHPLTLGGLGLLGTRPAVQAIEHCDLLLLVGTDFPYHDFYPRGAKVIQIDADPAQLGRRHPIQLGLVGHARPTLAALRASAQPKEDRSFLAEYQEAMRRWLAELDSHERELTDPLHPQTLARAVGDLATADAIFACDTGAVTYWCARNLRLRGSQRFTLSGNLATMGYALPAALAAALEYPGRQVIALVGDGALAMGMGEFLTAVQYGLPVKVIVFNNSKLGLIQMEQEARGLPEYETGLHNPDFGAFGWLCGGEGARVDGPGDLWSVLGGALASPKPCIVDVPVNPDELTVPPKIILRQALGYARAKLREFAGQGDAGTSSAGSQDAKDK